MSPERRRELARRGGISVHVMGRGHQFTSEEARAAGRKGGLANRRRLASGRALLLALGASAPDMAVADRDPDVDGPIDEEGTA